MKELLRLEYELTAADVAAGVDALTAPDARFMKLRPWLLRLVWLLLAAAGFLLAFLQGTFWTRLHRMGAPFRIVPPEYQAAVLGLPLLWLCLLLVVRRVSRDPDGALRWMRARLTRKLLAARAPGPRALILTPEGVKIEAGGPGLFRPWTAVRRSRRTERHLALDARDLWFIVPLHALPAADRGALLREVDARISV